MTGYAPIADYAMIGDCHGSALIRRDASIDWACLQRFDRGGVFCRLLDAEKGGSFRLEARDVRETHRRYLPNTNVLETTVVTKTGKGRILDCFTMRRGGKHTPYRQLLRVVEGVSGSIAFDVVIEPRFDYASLHPWLRRHGGDHLFTAVGGDDAVVLSSDPPLAIDDREVAFRGSIELRARHRSRFSLIAYAPHAMQIDRLTPRELDARLDETIAWWRRWVQRGSYRGEFRAQLVRSSLVLKLLTCAPTGAIIAAPTTSLPEKLGGPRNWDYRFCWIRDSTLAMAALLAVGHAAAAVDFMTFIERATAGRADELQIMYGCYGERRLDELELPHLDGYFGSRPARAGNAAASQLQLDVYGELLDAAHLWERAGRRLGADDWRFLRSLVDAASMRWKEPDHGMWESRGRRRHFVFSKAMCWLALSRGIQLAEKGDRPCDLAAWKKSCAAIRASIERHGVDPRRGCFVQRYGSTELDASLLRLPMIGFVDARDPRMKATVNAVIRELSTDGLIRRYRPGRGNDGMTGSEGAFLMASFWLVDVLTMQGRLREAKKRYRKLLTFGNDLGLFSEEYDPKAKLLLGNFPQAFTHIGLISSAAQLTRAKQGGDHHRRSLAERGNFRIEDEGVEKV